MAIITATRIIIPVTTNADTADKKINSLNKTFKSTEKQFKNYNAQVSQGNAKSQNLAKQLQAVSNSAKLFGDKTGGAAKQQEILRKKTEELLNKGVSPNNKGVQNLVGQYKALEAQTKKNQKTSSSFTKVLAGGAAIALGVSLVSGIKKSIQAGSDLLETQNKFIVTFKGVEAEAEKAAKVLQNSYGQSEKGAKAALASTGDLLTGFGFTSDAALDLSFKVQKLSTDLASFQNVDAANASEIITKALLGERDALTSVGAKILDTDLKARLAAKGLADLTGQARLQAQAQETLALITEQSANSLDDFIETSGSYANVSRRLEARAEDLSAKIGSKLAPSLAKAGESLLSATKDGSAFSGFIDGFIKDLDLAIKQVANFINLLTFGSNKISEALNFTTIETLNERLENLTEQARDLGGEGGLREFANQLNMGTEDAVALNEQIKSIRQRINALADENAEKNKQNKKLIDDITGASKENVDALTNADGKTKKLGGSTKNAAGDAKKLAEAYRDAVGVLAGTGDISFQIKDLELQFEEQKKIVRKAGLDITALEQFQLKQRENLFREYLSSTVENQESSIDERQKNLEAGLARIKNAENTTQKNRLAAERAFTEESKKLNQEWLESLAAGVEQYSIFATSAIKTGEAFAEFFNNETAQEIENLKARAAERDETAEKRQKALEDEIEALEAAGASRAEIAAVEQELEELSAANAEAKATRDKEIADKELALRQKQARQQKIFGIFSTLVDTAIAVTKTLASLPYPANAIAAGLVLIQGGAQTAAIANTPIPGAAFGINATVPPGNPADSALLRVNQGEDISVKPSRKSGIGGDFPDRLYVVIDGKEFNAYLVDKTNQNFNNGKVQIRRKGAVKTA